MPIEIKDVSYVYDPGLPSAKTALSHINLTFREGEFVGLIGHTGSGKSTLITLLNGLNKPTSGQILYNGEDINAFPQVKSRKKARQLHAAIMKNLRQKVGLVFQYPEHQLFESTVAEDIAFGPRNLGLSEEEIEKRVAESMEMTGLEESLKEKSPFELSGGQKRRVAIAGVLAMKPEFLVLDEPTAGLDPRGRDEILGEVSKLQKNNGLAVILVSHSMEDAARYTKRLVVMNDGRILYDASPSEVFSHTRELEEVGLGVPQMTCLEEQLKTRGFTFSQTILNIDQMEEAVLENFGRKETDNGGGHVS